MNQNMCLSLTPRHAHIPTARLACLWSFLALLMLFAGNAHSASFNCRDAKLPAEKLICSDKALGALDSKLAKTYQNARSGDDSIGTLIIGQRNWIKTVRDVCTTAACLTAAYTERIKVLQGDAASFDCDKAKTNVEKLICSDDVLRNADRSVALAYRSLRESGADRNKAALAQAKWLQDVRDRCATIACMRDAIVSRTAMLDGEREAFGAALRKDIGYAKKVFFSDTLLWPNDPARIIALYATQESAAKNPDADAISDEDYVIDVYVLDSASHKVLQHGTDSISSDAIELSALTIDRSDYGPRLGAPVFGVASSHLHYGCGGYESDSVRLYGVDGKAIRLVVSDIALSASSGKCNTECESTTVRRELRFSGDAKPFPLLTVQEHKREEREAGKGKKASACSVSNQHNQFKLRFENGKYSVPEALSY